jgi:hypothetical protein
MHKRFILLAVFVIAIIGALGGIHTQAARAQDPTIPTRTPTPDGSVAPVGTLAPSPGEGTIGSEIGVEMATPVIATPAADSRPSSGGAVNLILPLAGLGLIGIGIALALFAQTRKKQGGRPE